MKCMFKKINSREDLIHEQTLSTTYTRFHANITVVPAHLDTSSPPLFLFLDISLLMMISYNNNDALGLGNCCRLLLQPFLFFS